MRALTTVLMMGALTVACAKDEIPHRYENEGRLCVYPADVASNPYPYSVQSYAYPGDASFAVAVAFEGCLSGSCSKDVLTNCSVADTGAVLQVTSEGSYLELDRNACTTDCRLFVARCVTPVLGAGEHVFHHGADTLVLTLPSVTEPPCAGRLME